MNIGERIKRKRLALGLEQQKLAELIGLKKTTMSQIESGRCKPSLDGITRIASVLNCTTDYLINGEDQNLVLTELIDAFEKNGIKKEDISIEKLEKVIQMYKIME